MRGELLRFSIAMVMGWGVQVCQVAAQDKPDPAEAQPRIPARSGSGSGVLYDLFGNPQSRDSVNLTGKVPTGPLEIVSRPSTFAWRPGSGHSRTRLRRAPRSERRLSLGTNQRGPNYIQSSRKGAATHVVKRGGQVFLRSYR